MNEVADPLTTIGEIAVLWNRIENDFDKLTKLYVNTDAITLTIILKPMRPIDQEVFVRRLVSEKEPRKDVKKAILKALTVCGELRKNRNIILHSVGSNGGEISIEGLKSLKEFAECLPSFHEYFLTLVKSITAVVLDRESREIQADGESDEDEVRPIPKFVVPALPKTSRLLKVEDII